MKATRPITNKVLHSVLDKNTTAASKHH